jgi:hypothetical protein
LVSKQALIGWLLTAGYVDVAVKRWQTFTGQKATLFAATSPFDEVAAKRLDSTGADSSSGPALPAETQ